jgi:hypothetical protein
MPMKRNIYTVLFAIFAMVLTSCGLAKEEAISYNDNIINEQVAIIDKIDKLYDALKDYTNHYGMDYAYSEALKQVETGTGIVSKMDKFDGNAEFRDEALKLFGTYKSVLQNELQRMADISKLSNDSFTTDAEAEFNKLNDISVKKLDEAEKEFAEFQKNFANKYNFEIEKRKKY